MSALLQEEVVQERESYVLFGLPLNPMTMQEVLDYCVSAIRTRTSALIGVVNAAKVVAIGEDAELRDSLLECDIILADGQSVVWASHFLGEPLPERVAGIDLFTNLLEIADEHRLGVFLLGAKPEVLEQLVAYVHSEYPNLRIAGARDGYFDVEADSADVAGEIRRSNADMLFLGMTSPKKEIFLKDWGHTLRVSVQHGVGGSFDVLAGVTERAPLGWQKAGMEWFYRLLQEPRRMWKRYLFTNSKFIAKTFREKFKPTPRHEHTWALTGRPDPAPQASIRG